MKNTVVEVKVQLGNMKDGNSFNKIISDQLENYGAVGSELTEKFKSVNCLGCGPTGEFFIDFITSGDNLENSNQTVEQFMEELIRDLKDPNSMDDWSIVLEGEEIPSVEKFEIVCTKPYQY
ncbi:hypothetical protein [Bacillus toyonensis]|uniref:hypothetical protein n=1 Tax=Bacillus toyonensis TaxID=155322 RepID=UPI002E1A73D7|nr:hypothetical protein [Bacillus toyonensis]